MPSFKFGDNYKGAIMAPVLWVLLFVMAAGLVFGAFGKWQPVPRQTVATILPDSITKFHSIEVIGQSGAGLKIKVAFRQNPFFVVPLKRDLHNTKVHLSFGGLDKVKQIRVYPGLSGQPYLKSLYCEIPVGKAGGLRHDYNVLLPDGRYDNLRIDFESGDHYGTVTVKRISLHPVGVLDSLFWIYILAVMIAVLILLPGIFMAAFFHVGPTDEGVFLSLFMAYSVGFYVGVCLIWLLWNRVGLPHSDIVALVSVFFGIPYLCYLNIRKGRNRDNLVFYLRSTYKILLTYLFIVLAICFLLCYDSNLPLENTWYTSIVRSKTYGAFGAHDAVFQYVNGVAISNEEPFEKYYGHGVLIYGVEDRGILPGVIYAAFRILLRNFSIFLADSYLIYTIIGSCLNIMVFFPVFAFARRYTGEQNVYIFAAVFSLNAFILINFYLTWYKMAGAALFLGGLYLLLKFRNDIGRWGMAGMLFGGGASMHAGSALGIPLFFLWALFSNLRNRTNSQKKSLLAAALLIFVFAGINMPWAIIKHHYFNDQNRLIKEHFLSGYSDPEGIAKSIELFFKEIPLSQQVGHRFERLWQSLGFAEISDLFNALKEKQIRRFLIMWNQYEFTFTAFALYPAIFLFMLCNIPILKKNHLPDADRQPHKPESSPSVTTLLVLSFATLVTVIFLSYGRHAPDVTYHQPMAVLVLLCALLLGTVLRGNRIVYSATAAYFTVAAFRLLAFI